MDWIVADEPGRALPDVFPSLLAAMGTPGFTDTLRLPPCRSGAVLLIDGLGWELLREYAGDAPFLTELATRDPLRAGFPATTVTSLSSLGTGRRPGEHGMVGYTFAEPSGGLLHPLSWSTRPRHHTMLEEWPPEQVQPEPTVLEQAAAAGVRVATTIPIEFRDTGLTRAAFRGGEFRGVRAPGDLAAEIVAAVANDAPTLCYGYHGQLDLLGHVYGPGSLPWRAQLAQVDRLVATLAEHWPRSAVLAVVADHGMVAVDPREALDVDTDPALREGVRLIGGEVRVRHVYAEPGAEGEVYSTWRDRVGTAGLVLSRDQAIDEGWFGPVVADAVRPRIGDVLAVMRESGVICSRDEPGESSLAGHHGSVTAAEQLVPLLVVGG
jgi:predicted AlkP superfamily pyrophosphatase or phosphodiesterase